MSIEKSALIGARALLGTRRSALTRAWGWWYVTEHRLVTMRAYLWSILGGSVGQPLVYLLAMGVGLGALVDANTGSHGVDGVSYITFVGPALLASAAITTVFEEMSFPVMAGFKWSREFWAMNATALTPAQIVNGVTLGAMIRVTFTVATFWAILALFGAAPSPWSALAVLATALGGLAFGSLGMAFAASLDEDDGYFALVGRFVIAPMFLFSGTFYPLSGLPVALQAVGWVSPLWHATELGRWLTYGHSLDAVMVAVHFGYLALLTAVGMTLSYRIFARRLAK